MRINIDQSWLNTGFVGGYPRFSRQNSPHNQEYPRIPRRGCRCLSNWVNLGSEEKRCPWASSIPNINCCGSLKFASVGSMMFFREVLKPLRHWKELDPAPSLPSLADIAASSLGSRFKRCDRKSVTSLASCRKRMVVKWEDGQCSLKTTSKHAGERSTWFSIDFMSLYGKHKRNYRKW